MAAYRRILATFALLLVFFALQLEGVLSVDSALCANLRCPNRISCPSSCPKFNNPNARQLCVVDCFRCRSICRRNVCARPGAVCSDPRFVGGDGIFFYFHGKANEDFCIVSDDKLHINSHFIGTRPAGRPRDFTWVQAIGILYGSHRVRVGAKKVAKWNAVVDQLEMSYDEMPVQLATKDRETWTSPKGELHIMRTDDVNSVEVKVKGMLTASINVTHVSKEDSKVHGYGITEEDCFAHLDMQFSFFNLSAEVGGVLGQTYRPNYESRVKVGVPMPIMGGYDKFKSSSLFEADCAVSRFREEMVVDNALGTEDRDVVESIASMRCDSGGENGIVCRR